MEKPLESLFKLWGSRIMAVSALFSKFDFLGNRSCSTWSLTSSDHRKPYLQTSSGMTGLILRSYFASFNWSTQLTLKPNRWHHYERLSCLVGHFTIFISFHDRASIWLDDLKWVVGSHQMPLFYKFQRTFHALDLLLRQFR